MNPQLNKIFSKLAKEEKTELASEKVELANVKDLKKNVQDVDSFLNSVTEQFKKVGKERITLQNLNKQLKKEANVLIKNMSSIEKQAKDLGLNINNIDIYKRAEQLFKDADKRIKAVDKFVK